MGLARLMPLDGKWYGTTVEFIADHMRGEITFGIRGESASGSNQPSDRELAYHGITREQHERLYRDDPDSTPVDITGGHYENRATYETACTLVIALRNQTALPSNWTWADYESL